MDWIEKHHGNGHAAQKYRAELYDFSEIEIALYDALSSAAGNCPLCKGTRKADDLFIFLTRKDKSEKITKSDCSWCLSANQALDMANPNRKHRICCKCDDCEAK